MRGEGLEVGILFGTKPKPKSDGKGIIIITLQNQNMFCNIIGNDVTNLLMCIFCTPSGWQSPCASCLPLRGLLKI
jgi:hypothetical protein